MATSVGQDDVEKINEDKTTVPDRLVHEGDLSNYKPDDNGPLDKTESDGVGVGVGLDGGADAKASGIECILNHSSTESTNKKKRKNKKKKRNNKVGVSDSSGGIGENLENLVAKDSDDVSVGNLTKEPDEETEVKTIEENQAILEQEIGENMDKVTVRDSGISDGTQSTEPDVETVVKKIEKKQAISEVDLKEPADGSPVVDEKEPFFQIQHEKKELDATEGREKQNQEFHLVSDTKEEPQLSGLIEEPEHELDYSKIFRQSALGRVKEPTLEIVEKQDEMLEDELNLKEVIQTNIIETKEKPDESESQLSDTESTAAIDITLQPSVKFIFQSDGNIQIGGPCESSAHFTESESALAAELNAASRSGFHDASVQESANNTDESLKQGPSENSLKTRSDDCFGGVSDNNLSNFCDSDDPIRTNSNYFQDLQEQYAWTQIDTSHLQPDDIFNNNYLRSDSQDFENRWEKECYLLQESNTSFKMPIVPNPSLDNIQLSPSEQVLATYAAEQNGRGFSKRATDFLDNKVTWKDQNPNFVATVRFTVREIVDTASSKMEALMNRYDENETPEGEVVAGLDLGFGLIKESGSKTSDSMNNLYEVEGDLEYTARYGTYPSECFTYEPPVDELEIETLNGEILKIKLVSVEGLTEGAVKRSASQGFIVDEARQGSNEEHLGDYKTLNNLDCDRFDYGDALASHNLPTEGLTLSQLDDELKSAAESDDFESEVNEVFYDAKSNSSSQYQSTSTSPREPHLPELVVEETLDASFNSKIQYFESELEKVALSVSQQYLKGPSRTQSESGVWDSNSQTSHDKVLPGQNNLSEADKETGNFNKLPHVGTSSLSELLTNDNIPEFGSDSVEGKRENEVKSIEFLVPNQSKPKHKRIEDVKSLSEYLNTARYYEGLDWTEYVLTPSHMAQPRTLTFEEIAAILKIKDDDPLEEIQQTHEVPQVPQTQDIPFDEVPQNHEFKDIPQTHDAVPFKVVVQIHENPFEKVKPTIEALFEDVPLTPEVPFEEVQQKYERPLTNERKCGSFKRAVPCLFSQSTVSAPSSEDKIMNSDLEGTQKMTGNVFRKSGERKPVGTSGFNFLGGRGRVEPCVSLECEGSQEHGGTMKRLKRWKAQSLKRFNKPNQ